MKLIPIALLISLFVSTVHADEPSQIDQPKLPVKTEPAVQQDNGTPAWIRASSPSTPSAADFPAAPQTSSQQIKSAFPPSNFGAQNYAVNTAQNVESGTVEQSNQGVAPLPPLSPPSNYAQIEKMVAPFSPADIKKLRDTFDETRAAKAYKPTSAIPRISSVSVDLSPGSSLPIARTLPGETTTLIFIDATGAPWPIAAAPRLSDDRLFDVEWLDKSPAIIVSAKSPYESANLTVFLHGMATPVIVKLASGEPDSELKQRIVDYRLDIRVPGRGPNAKSPLLSDDKISLYDDTLQSFLDGIPPAHSKKIKIYGEAPASTQVWELAGYLFIRTQSDIQTAFDQTISSGDGTRVYKLPLSPYVTLSAGNREITLRLDI